MFPWRRFLQASIRFSGRNRPSTLWLVSACDPTHGMSLFHLRHGFAGDPRMAGAVLPFSAVSPFPFSFFTGGVPLNPSWLSFAILPPGLPTGSKADVSFETTGALNTRPSPFGDLALASWQ
jgi:hypothetical protein